MKVGALFLFGRLATKGRKERRHTDSWIGREARSALKERGRPAPDPSVAQSAILPHAIERVCALRLVFGRGRDAPAPWRFPLAQFVFKTSMNASCGMFTRPMLFIRFFPSFCFSRSLRLRLMSPP